MNDFLEHRLNNIMSSEGSIIEDDDIYSLLPTNVEIPKAEYLPVPSKDVVVAQSDSDDDYLHTRNTLHGVIDRSKDLLELAIQTAARSDNPKLFDSVVNIIKAINDTTKTLNSLHGKPSAKGVNADGQVNIQNNTYNYAAEVKQVEDILDSLPDVVEGEIVP